MKKVIIFSTASQLYGSERGVLNLSRALKARFDVWAVLNKRGLLQQRLEAEGVRVKVFPLSYLAFSFSPFFWVRNVALFFVNLMYFVYFIKDRNIDLVCSNNSLLLFPLFVSPLTRRPLIAFFRENYNCRFIQKNLAKLFLFFSHRLIFVSQNLRDLSEVKEKDAEVLYDCFSSSDFRYVEDVKRKWGIPEGKIVVSYISRLHPSKGQREFLEAVSRALSSIKRDVLFVVAGDTAPKFLRLHLYRRRLLSFIHCQSLQERVVLAGFRDINELLSASDIIAYCPQKDEPWGLNILEALCWQKKTVLDIRGGLREITEEFDTSLIRQPFSSGALAEEINRFSPVKQRRFVVPEKFSFAAYRAKLGEIVSKI